MFFFTANPVVPCSLITNDTYYLPINDNIVSMGRVLDLSALSPTSYTAWEKE